jgi:hypothetical protein
MFVDPSHLSMHHVNDQFVAVNETNLGSAYNKNYIQVECHTKMSCYFLKLSLKLEF